MHLFQHSPMYDQNRITFAETLSLYDGESEKKMR
jgi:hypothetical protein